LRSVSSVRSGTDGSSADAYRHSTAYGCATVNTAAINAAVMDTNAANTNAPTAICERISRNHSNAPDADDDRRGQREDRST